MSLLARLSFHRFSVPALTAIALAVAATLLFTGIGKHSISLRSDEVIYVRVTQTLLHEESWFPLRHGYAHFFEKPPLKLWVGAIFPWLIGESTLSYRVIDPLLGMGMFVFVIVAARCVLRIPLVGPAAVLFLCGSFELMVSHHSLRRAVLDGLLSVITLGSMICSWKALNTDPLDGSVARIRRSPFIWLGILSGFAILTKSVAGALPLVWTGAAILLRPAGRFDLRIWIAFALWSVGVAAIVASAYFVPIFLLYPKSWTVLFGSEIAHRAMEGFAGHNTGDPWYYARFLVARSGCIPAAILLWGIVASMFLAFRDFRFRFLIIWSLGPIILFSAAASKAPWYLHPAFGPLALLSVGAVIESARRIPRLRVPLVVIIAVALLDFTKLLSRVTQEVIDQRHELDIERFVRSACSNDLKSDPVVVVGGAISGRVAPVKGRFNVEGFYLNMLGSRVVRVPSFDRVDDFPAPHSFLILSHNEPPSADFHCSAIDTLDPLFPRLDLIQARRCRLRS